MITNRGKLRAFTLVELVAATALSALLMTTLLAVVASLGRERNAIAHRATEQTPPALLELLRWDCVNARTVRLRERSVMFTGFGSLDPRSLTPTVNRPVEVIYEVQQMGGRSWLCRRQQEPGNPGRASTELVCAGVQDIAVVPFTGNGSFVQDVLNAHKAAVPMTATVRLKIAFDSKTKRPVDEVMVLR
ncbi:MAG: hypothetical protein JWM57_1098 [Phycisphaerales bacterium]|nr:hypothetical protein [Phycisphaerales bacterium]